MSNMLLRAITGGVFVGIVIFCILFSPEAFTILMYAFAVLSLWEYAQWYKNEFSTGFRFLFQVLGLLLLFLLSVNGMSSPLLLVIFPILGMSALYLPSGKFMSFVGKSLLGWLVIVVPIVALLYLRHTSGNNSYYYVMLFFATMWINDTGAYLSGRAFGKHKLFERISPKKTWEGFFGGVILSIVGGIVASFVFSNGEALLFNIGFTAVVSLGGAYGDLLESAMKRELNIKDSGNILPGHGGILDRLDGVFMAAPLAFCYFYFLQHLIA